MSEETLFTESEAHRHFAIKYNGRCWELLEKSDRSREENEILIEAAHASLAHWREAGTGVQHQRGEWMLARTYVVVGIAEAAVYHADRCLALAKEHRDLMEDFDWAYAYEAVARANAIAGNRERANEYLELATRAGKAIADAQSKEIFAGDFDGGDWAGLR